MTILLRWLSYLPLPVLYVISDGLAWMAWRVVRYRRPVIVANLSQSFPEKTPEEIQQLAHAFYYNLSDVVVETLKGITISEKELRRRVVFRNLEVVQAYYEQQQSLVLLTTHQCNWEWLLLAGCLYLPYPVDAVYKPLANKKMDTLMYNTRARFGGQPISKDRVLREVLRRKRQTRAIAIVADQTPAPGTPKHWITFMHRETGFYRGIEQLPKAVQYPTFFVAMKRIKRGYYEVSFVPIGAPPYEKDNLSLLTRYVEEAELLIREQPADWLWSHKRWKHVRPASE